MTRPPAMFIKLLAAWDRQPFLARLLVTASFALLVAGSVMLLVSARQEALDSRKDLAAELANELETLPAALAEVVVIGDFATLQQTLDRFVRRPHIYRVEYRDQTGALLRGIDANHTARAPDWFVTALRFDNLTGSTEVNVGGRIYGELELEMTAQGQAVRAWNRLLHHLAILLLAVVLDFIGIWLVLRNGLAPLQHLEQGAAALARGELDVRLKEQGSPEMRHLITGFNQMATATQTALAHLARGNAELQRFAEIAAHHLQEPARRLATYAQHLREQLAPTSLDEDTRLSLEFIQQQARRQQALIHDVQRYLAAGQGREEPASLDVAEVLEEVLARMREPMNAAGARVEIAPLPPVRLDPQSLAELFNLLLDNALHHGRTEHPLVVRISGETGDGYTRIRVADNGHGIAPEYRERVFRVFERLSSVNPGDGNGTGVGLAIVRRIAESAGGRAWIEETPGGGCTVNFELPTGNTA